MRANGEGGWGARVLVLALWIAIPILGCERREIRTYRVERESVEPAPPTVVAAGAEQPVPGVQAPVGSGGAAAVVPGSSPGGAPSGASWPVPDGWERREPGGMRAASYRIVGAGDEGADMSVIPLAGGAGGDLDNVNRWRGQLGLGPVTEAQLGEILRRIDVGGKPVATVEISGGDPARRMLAAIYRAGDATWFFKLVGPDALVAGERERFLDFVRKAPIFGAN